MSRMLEAHRAELAASRAGAAAQARAWQRGPEWRALAATFADCPLDSPEIAAARAERWLAQDDWVAALLAPLLGALAADPFFEPPFKASRDAARIGATLFDCPAVTISASVSLGCERAAEAEPATIVFSGRASVTRYVRAGGASLHLWRVADEAPDRCVALAPEPLTDGAVHRADGRTQAHLALGGNGTLATLVALVRAGARPAMHSFDVRSGAIVRVASGDDGASRAEMLLAFLRHADRADGQAFAAATRDLAHQLRWAAMREWLACDAAAALPRLAQLAAQDPHPHVRDAAAVMLPRVRATVEAARCRS